MPEPFESLCLGRQRTPMFGTMWYRRGQCYGTNWYRCKGFFVKTGKNGETGQNHVRDRILEAAWQAFMKFGYAEASTLEIATRARVSKRELYALFGNKQAMLSACITD